MIYDYDMAFNCKDHVVSHKSLKNIIIINIKVNEKMDSY